MKKKGELPSGWYYVQLQEGVYADNVKSIIMDYYTDFCDFMKHPYLIEQVLAPVPSYEEWKQLNIENKQLEKFCEEFNALNVAQQNAELKELLKELFETADLAYCEEDLLDKIDEVLK